MKINFRTIVYSMRFGIQMGVHMRIGICDDESIQREHLKKLCSQYIGEKEMQMEIVEFTSGEEVLKYNNQLDVLLLDIEMDGIDGILVKKNLLEIRNDVAIIFITNYIDRMKESFGKNVYGYISKGEENQRLFELLEIICMDRRAFCMIEVEDGLVKKDIRSDSIICFEVNDKYVDIHTYKKIYIKRISMKKLNELLSPYDFYRLDRKKMINLKYVENVVHGIKLNNGNEYKLSNKLHIKFINAYSDYIRRKAK